MRNSWIHALAAQFPQAVRLCLESLPMYIFCLLVHMAVWRGSSLLRSMSELFPGARVISNLDDVEKTMNSFGWDGV